MGNTQTNKITPIGVKNRIMNTNTAARVMDGFRFEGKVFGWIAPEIVCVDSVLYIYCDPVFFRTPYGDNLPREFYRHDGSIYGKIIEGLEIVDGDLHMHCRASLLNVFNVQDTIFLEDCHSNRYRISFAVPRNRSVFCNPEDDANAIISVRIVIHSWM